MRKVSHIGTKAFYVTISLLLVGGFSCASTIFRSIEDLENSTIPFDCGIAVLGKEFTNHAENIIHGNTFTDGSETTFELINYS